MPKEPEKPPESTPQSTTATEEPSKEPEATEPTGADADADVVVSQQPMEEEGDAVEYEEPLKGLSEKVASAPDVRGVPLKHITPLGTKELGQDLMSTRDVLGSVYVDSTISYHFWM